MDRKSYHKKGPDATVIGKSLSSDQKPCWSSVYYWICSPQRSKWD